jgi:hypothetical protein
VAAPGQTLEALVRDELRGPITELVRRVVLHLAREEIARLNGVPAPVPEANGQGEASAPTWKRCLACGEEKPSSAFERGRNQCRQCRGRQDAERKRRRRALARGSAAPAGEDADDEGLAAPAPASPSTSWPHAAAAGPSGS